MVDACVRKGHHERMAPQAATGRPWVPADRVDARGGGEEDLPSGISWAAIRVGRAPGCDEDQLMAKSMASRSLYWNAGPTSGAGPVR